MSAARPLPRPLLAVLATGLLTGATAATGEGTALPVDHWSRAALRALPFPDGDPRTEGGAPPLRTRFDAAVQLARWLERGLPTADRRVPLLIDELAEELRILGLSPDRARRDADAKQLGDPGLRDPWHYSRRSARVRERVRDTLGAMEGIDARLRELQARARALAARREEEARRW